MPQPPVILLAFANDRQGRFLRSIAAEQRAIVEALRPAVEKDWCEVVSLPDAQVSDLLSAFRRYRGRVRVFHYGGHADDYRLLLDSVRQTEIEVSSLGQFLAQQEDLELVFMNGCSTLAQKDELLAAGVKQVILTSQAINDAAAQQFGGHFYQSLASGLPIAAAFAEAQAAIQVESGTDTRALYWEEKAEPGAPWQLYPAETSSEWKLQARPVFPWLLIGTLALVLGGLGLWWGLSAPAPVSLRVQSSDPHGDPSTWVQQELRLRVGDYLSPYHPFNARGEVVFTEIPGRYLGDTLHFEARDTALTVFESSPQLLDPDQVLQVDLRWMAETLLHGRVIGPDQRGLDRILVDVAPYGQDTTIENGFFSLKLPVAPGTRIQVRLQSLADTLSAQHTLTLSPQAQTLWVE